MSILEPKAVAPVFLALLIGGCPKRQAVPRVVYVQPPASSSTVGIDQTGATTAASQATPAANNASAPAQSTEALVIQEPPPPPAPEPVTAPAPPAATPAEVVPKPRTRPRTDSHGAEEDTAPADSAVPASAGNMPSLEPRSDAPDDGIESQLQAQDDEIRRRINELNKNAELSSTERRTLKDASSFWSQSMAAVREHDLLRARELAQKASLLLAALEKR